jgi:hypothetical protein
MQPFIYISSYREIRGSLDIKDIYRKMIVLKILYYNQWKYCLIGLVTYLNFRTDYY